MLSRKFKTLWRQLLLIDKFRWAVSRTRLAWLRQIHGFKTYQSPDADPVTVEYSMSGLIRMLDSRRSNILIRPLTVLERLHSNSKILCIGPRSEAELLLFYAYGFELENIRGLDLFSYSPWIDVGDMHKMPYGDSSWDAVVSSMVITYSANQALAAREMIRVTKPGGIIAINLTYFTEEDGKTTIATAEPSKRPQTTDKLLALFGNAVDYVYFRQDHFSDFGKTPPNLIKGDPGDVVSVIFSVRKP